jgi:phage-related protein
MKLTAELFHEANRDGKIWEFIKGRLRVYCFMEEGALVILTHGAIKKSQKANRNDIARAMRMRNAYLAARQRGDLQWEILEHD